MTHKPDIGLVVRVFTSGPGDLGSVPGRVIPKTQKMVLDASLLNTQNYKVQIKGKVEQSREGVAPSPTPWCSSYRKGSLRVTLDYGCQLYFFYLWPINGTLTGTTSPNQREPGSNGNKVVTQHSIEFQKWDLTTKCSLLSYSGQPFFL